MDELKERFEREITELYNGYEMTGLSKIEEISEYNHNYYIGLPRSKGVVDLLLGVSDDDNTTEWYVIDGLNEPKPIGYSYTSKYDALNIYFEICT